MFPNQPDSPTFGLSFKVYPGTDPAGPAVIFLTGGPGEAEIGTEREADGLPETFTWIETDLRGIGCNAPPSPDYYPDAFYGTVNFADDVLAIVKELKLTNYLIQAVSYGTELATVIASRAEAQGAVPPKALVLEGVLGRAFEADEDVEAGYLEGWDATKGRLPEDIRSQLEADPLPLGLSAEQWGGALETLLTIGATPIDGGPYADYRLSALDAGASDEARAELREFIIAVSGSLVDDFGRRLFVEVACRELSEDNFLGAELRAGAFVPTDPVCADQAVDAAFAAADWPVTVPIYYYSGTADPATPPWQADAHFAAETGAPRHLMRLARAGHNAFSVNLDDCKPALWQAMASNMGYREAADTCSWDFELSEADPDL